MDNLSPEGIINLLLGGDYQKLGRDNIDSVEVEGFEFQQPAPFTELGPKPILDVQSVKGKVWIGIEEQLPVRVEGNLLIGKSFMTMFNDVNLYEVNTFHNYNAELDEKIFDTEIPEGYTELGLSDILPFIPTEAKAGLAGLGIVPAGLLIWTRRRKKKKTARQN